AGRADFAQILLDHARGGGVQVIEGRAVNDVGLGEGAGVTLRTRQGPVEAAFFVDASGHAGVLARQRLRRRDETFQTLALTAYWRRPPGTASADLSTTPPATH